MKVKHVVLSVFAAAWITGGVWATPWVAGGIFMLSNKASPLSIDRSTWGQSWDQLSDIKPQRKKLQATMGVALFLCFGVPLILILANLNKARGLHGDARWATKDEIEKAGLMSDEGIILGKIGGRFLMMNLAKFVMLCAPTRSGKGTGTIIPNLLNWPDSTVVVDIKGENLEVTSGFRAKHGQEVFKFAPFDPEFRSHRWNPLSYVNRDERFVVGELQSIGYMLYPRAEGTTGFFNDQARNLFVGVSLYCIECDYPLTLGEVLRRSNGGGRPKTFWQDVVDGAVTPDGVVLSERFLNAMRQFVGNSENTLTSILASFNAPLGTFANPSVDAATSADDFDVRDVRRKRTTIYVVIPPSRLSESSLLVNLFFSVVIDQNTKVLPESDPSLKYRCLLVLDEFPALRRVDKFVQSIGYIAGYGLLSLTIAQSRSQLQDKDLYGQEGMRTLEANHMVQIMYAPREQKDAQEYSEVLGYATEKGSSKGRSSSSGKLTRSENVSDQKRALMMPQELRELGDDKVIVLSDNCKPILADKIRYYEEAAFKERLLPPIEVPRLDVDAHIARTEGRIRDALPGEVVAPARLVLADAAMPKVTPGTAPIAAEVHAMADFLFSNVKWTVATPAPRDSDVSMNEVIYE